MLVGGTSVAVNSSYVTEAVQAREGVLTHRKGREQTILH